MNTIAVLSSNYISTLEWLLNVYLKNIPKTDLSINQSRGTITTKNNRYIIVSTNEQIYGLEINDIIKAPNYSSLEDVAKSRIR
jgi:hypothetical protein